MDVEEQRCDLESPLIPDPQEHALQSRKGLLNNDEIVEEVKKQLLSLAGASMATSFASVTGLSLILGMCSALDTFCAFLLQLYGPNAGNILQFLGQDPEISSAAGDYARFMIPCIFAYAILQCHARFLQTQNNVVPMIVSTGTATLLHLLICWVMVYKTSLGYRGAAVANALTLLDQCIVIVSLCQSFPLLQEHMDWILKGGLPWNSPLF
ncbi:hypothetical protein M0R45_027420 [Rubus argutus]|uniref:Uncharacterized protein n=1 Tax=Rubus argutus TaxID=59490 RepID=A0AAW1X247_RUBAR